MSMNCILEQVICVISNLSKNETKISYDDIPIKRREFCQILQLYYAKVNIFDNISDFSHCCQIDPFYTLGAKFKKSPKMQKMPKMPKLTKTPTGLFFYKKYGQRFIQLYSGNFCVP